MLLLAVKPQDIDTLLALLAEVVDDGHLVVSVAAGVPTARIEAALPAGVPVVRVMPNTPALVDEGMSVLSAGAHAGEEHLDEAEALLAAVGQVRRVPESQQDAVTALSGRPPRPPAPRPRRACASSSTAPARRRQSAPGSAAAAQSRPNRAPRS